MVQHKTTATTEYGHNGSGSVQILDDAVYIERCFSVDAQVLSRFRDTAEAERLQELGRVLSVGATVLNAASPLLDVAQVHQAFALLAEQHKKLIVEGAKSLRTEIGGALDPVFGEKGILKVALADTEQVLKSYLDEKSTKSVMTVLENKMNALLDRHKRELDATVTKALDLNDENSSISRALKRIAKENQEATSELTKAATALTAAAAGQRERDMSTRKGPDYQQGVLDEVARIAAIHGDCLEPTAETFGEARRRRGDGVITIDSALTDGREIRVVVEPSNNQSMTLSKVLLELDEAKENRSAIAAIKVLPGRHVPATSGQRLQRFGEGRVICVVDPENWDTLALEVAYTLARFEAIKSLQPDVSAASTGEAIQREVDLALEHLTKLDATKTALKTGRDQIEKAQSLLQDCGAEIRGCISRIAVLLKGGAAD